ncbi:MAG: carbohydrate ABC transporter permease [Candidatus Kapaibacterium sp.]
MIKKYLIYSLLIIVAVGMAFPIVWMLILSLKTNPETLDNTSKLLFSDYNLNNYKEAITSDSFDKYLFNSLFVSIIVTIGNIFFCTITGYVLARKKFRGNKLILISIIGVMMIPPHVIMIPLYRTMVNFDWINSYQALIIPWLITPFGVFLVKQYLSNIPEAIEQAAIIDGASQLQLLFKIIFPLAKPIIIVLAVYVFLMNWNSFLFPFLFTNNSDYWTLPVGLTFYLGKQSIDWGHLMSGASMSAIPIIVLFMIFQKQIIKGLTAGAIKE